MGAPIGSLIISDKARIQKALKWRKILGGGMRQVGYIAACGLYALENNLPLLKIDHENARFFALEIASLDGISIDLGKVQTNIVIFELESRINSEDFVEQCKESGLLLSNVGDNKIRIVTYHQISKEAIQNAVGIVTEVMKKMMRN
jgi:threonine aldolase